MCVAHHTSSCHTRREYSSIWERSFGLSLKASTSAAPAQFSCRGWQPATTLAPSNRLRLPVRRLCPATSTHISWADVVCRYVSGRMSRGMKTWYEAVKKADVDTVGRDAFIAWFNALTMGIVFLTSRFSTTAPGFTISCLTLFLNL